MDNYIKSTSEQSSQHLQVWCCDNCQVIHFKAENVMLNFTRTEFADLTHAVMEIYQQQFGSLEFCDLISLLEKRGDVLISQTVS